MTRAYCIICKTKYAYYGLHADRVRKYCGPCCPADLNLVHLDKALCTNNGCLAYATHGHSSFRKKLYCEEHAIDGCIRLERSQHKCLNCRKNRARYGNKPQYQSAPPDYRYCFQCSKVIPGNWCNVTRKVCIQDECFLSATRRNSDGTLEYCQHHAPSDYTRRETKPCLTCGANAKWGLPKMPARYCKKHAPEGYIEVYGIRCKLCNAIPAEHYYVPSDTEPAIRICVDCKATFPPDKTYARSWRSCEMCPRAALYGIEGEPPIRCGVHRESYARTSGNCNDEECARKASFGFVDNKPVFCRRHATVDMVNLTSKQCVKCKKKHSVIDDHCVKCHPDYIPKHGAASKIACEWLDHMGAEAGVHLQHLHYDTTAGAIVGDEYRADCLPQSPVDGYDAETMTMYEFLGDEFHGHPSRFKTPDGTNMYGSKYQELFKRTEEKFKTLCENGYVVKYVWEYDFRRWRRKTNTDPHLDVYMFDGKLRT